MMQPKRTKYRKRFKGRNEGLTKRGAELNFGSFGMKATDNARVTRARSRRRGARSPPSQARGPVWIRIFPDVPVSKKPAEVRMGKGKGSVEYWVVPVKAGRIMFEIDGVSAALAEEAIRRGGAKLPVRTRFVGRPGEAA